MSAIWCAMMQDGQLVGVGSPGIRHDGVVCAQGGGLGLDMVGRGSCVAVGVLDVVFVKSSAEAGVGKSFEAMISDYLLVRVCVCGGDN
jgi:hypothetical protein